MADRLVTRCGKLLIENELTIAFAESITSGRMAAEFSLVPDAGKFLKGSLVCYDASLKKDLLHVSTRLINKYTPESPQVTEAITKGLLKLIPADIHIGITGLASPGGSETPEKPVGTVFVHALLKKKLLFAERFLFPGSPEKIILSAVRSTAELLSRTL